MASGEQLRYLKEYYREGLVLVGMNEMQGIIASKEENSFLEQLGDSLSESENKIQIDAFSLLISRTEHIDSMLKHNPSLEEIKLLKQQAAICSYEKAIAKLHLPAKTVRKLARRHPICSPKPGDKAVFLTDTLRNAQSPLVIYSSGVHNIMRELFTNPSKLKKDFQNRHLDSAFEYSISKANDETLDKVVDDIEKNFLHLLSINPTTDIFALASCLPKCPFCFIKRAELNIFTNLIASHNEKLKQLCEKYSITYIDTNAFLRKPKSIHFHLSKRGQEKFREYLLEQIYQKKIQSRNQNMEIPVSYCNDNKGVAGMREDALLEKKKALKLAKTLYCYERKVAEETAQEYQNEADIFQKVLSFRNS